jgi:hypothetical protein
MMFYIIQEEINGVWGASVLSDPKRLAWQPDGTVHICEYLPDNVERRLLFSSESSGYGEWVSHGGEWTSPSAGILTAPGGEAFLMETLWGTNLAMEADIAVSAGSLASLIVRGNPSAMAGYRISLDVERQQVGLYLRWPGTPDRPLQERPVALRPEGWHNLKVVVEGKFFEIYVDGVLQLVRDHGLYDSGCFGLHAHGMAHFRRVMAYVYQGPEEAEPDWQRHCRPRHLFP